MNLFDQICEDLKAAMKAREKEKSWKRSEI
jgi:uncharacterized protein YqeY